jgi:ABC transporter substrate binding protein (PQQ-dependent alcohol dehydrogenase system)
LMTEMKEWLSKLIVMLVTAIPGTTQAIANDSLPTVSIGFLDLTADIRYDEWEIHPVDIRSSTAIVDRRAYAGAQLAIQELEQFTRIANAHFSLERHSLANATEMVKTIVQMRDKGSHFFLLDAPSSVISEVARLTLGENVYLFNTTSISDELRNESCQKHLFHIAASRAMKTDAVAQYLVERKWTKVLVLRGPLKQDSLMASAFERSAMLFGLKIVETSDFVLGNDPRAREQNDLDFLTGNKRYDAVFVADSDGEFALSVPYATREPAAVVGAAGIIPRVWHWTYFRHGAPQVHGRFERMHMRRMGEPDWGAWVSLKTIAMAIARSKSTNPAEVANYLRNDKFRVDGSKGPGMGIRPWNNQLRQPLLLTTDNWTITRAPIKGFKHRTNDLDTLGYGIQDSTCTF